MTPAEYQAMMQDNATLRKLNRTEYAPGVEKLVTPKPSKIELRQSHDMDKLNKTEKSFLEWLRVSGSEWIGVQSVTLKLGDDCRYTPDFVTLQCGKLMAWEVKGFMRDDALVKLKSVARQFSFITFTVVKRYGAHAWTFTEIKP